MNLVIVSLIDELNPIELITWFSANPSVDVRFILNNGRVFYIFYN